MKDVFISYKSEEFDIACLIKNILEGNGISCWMAPDSIEAGRDYLEEIPKGIEECSVFLLLLSEVAQTSRWVKSELSTAVGKEKLVIPFMVSKCDITTAFQFALTNSQRIDAYENLSDSLEKLVGMLKRNIEKQDSVDVLKEKAVENKKSKENRINANNIKVSRGEETNSVSDNEKSKGSQKMSLEELKARMECNKRKYNIVPRDKENSISEDMTPEQLLKLEEINKLCVGDVVNHTIFGKGVVYDNSDFKMIEITFGKDWRIMDKVACVKKDYIQKVY